MSVKRMSSKIKEYFSDELMAEMIKIYNARQFITYKTEVAEQFTGTGHRIKEVKDGKTTFLIRDNNAKINLIKEFIKIHWGTDVNFGTGTNRMAVIKDGLVFKIANDEAGCIDNLHEYIMSKELQPYVTKVYETNELICVQEYVKVLNQTEDFNAMKDKIMKTLDILASKTSLMIDVGFIPKNKSNWGVRPDGTPVILDFGYVYKNIDGINLTCMEPDCVKKHGISNLVYTDSYATMICPKCATKVTTLYLQSLVTTEARRSMYSDKLEYSIVVNKPVTYIDINEFGEVSELKNASDSDVSITYDTKELEEVRELYMRLCDEIDTQRVFNKNVDASLLENKEKIRLHLLELEYGVKVEDMDEDMFSYDPYNNLKRKVDISNFYRHEIDFDAALVKEAVHKKNITSKKHEREMAKSIDNMYCLADEHILMSDVEIHNALASYVGDPLIEEKPIEEEDDDYYGAYIPNARPGSDADTLNIMLGEYHRTREKIKEMGVVTLDQEEDNYDFAALTGMIFDKKGKDEEGEEIKVVAYDEDVAKALADVKDWSTMISFKDDDDDDDNEPLIDDEDDDDYENSPSGVGVIIQKIIEEDKRENARKNSDDINESDDEVILEKDVITKEENPGVIIDVKIDNDAGEVSKVIEKDGKDYVYMDQDETTIDDNPFAKLLELNDNKDKSLLESDKIENHDLTSQTKSLETELIDEDVFEIVKEDALENNGDIVEENVDVVIDVALENNDSIIVEENVDVVIDVALENNDSIIVEEINLNNETADVVINNNSDCFGSSIIINEDEDDDYEDPLAEFKEAQRWNEEDEIDQQADFENTPQDYKELYSHLSFVDEDPIEFYMPLGITIDTVKFVKVPLQLDIEVLKNSRFPYLYDADTMILGFEEEDEKVFIYTNIGNIEFNDTHCAYIINDKIVGNKEIVEPDDVEEEILDSRCELIYETDTSRNFTLEDYDYLIDSRDFEEFDEDRPMKRNLKLQANEFNLTRFNS